MHFHNSVDFENFVNHVQNEIAFMSQRLEISDKKKMNAWFNERRKSLIEAKIVDNVDSSSMTMDQAKALVEAIYANFMTDKKEETA